MKNIGGSMPVNLNVREYRKWLDRNVSLKDPFSVEALREIVTQLLLGRNYRILTEQNTKDRLNVTYIWLQNIVKNARKNYGEEWREKLLDQLLSSRNRSKEETDLSRWLIGLTKKTADNLDIKTDDLPDILAETVKYFNDLFAKFGKNVRKNKDEIWLLMMAGAATLSVRGSQKSKYGKLLEKLFIQTCLSLLGLEKDKHFWTDVERDLEVEREIDAEVQTKRGRVRIEVALIAPGNQEVIEDKISSVGQRGIVIYDRIGIRSQVSDTANARGVKLIQIRHNQPLVELYRYLRNLVDVELREPPTLVDEIRRVVSELGDSILTVSDH
jgi:hypothetical protein